MRVVGFIFFLGYLLVGATAQAQILDDSTKQVFGPETALYTFERNIKYNQEEYFQVDTVLDNRHRYSIIDKREKKYQDLGNIGTALRSVFFQPNTSIGAQSGYNAYKDYRIEPDDIKYFDTKSPYANLDVIFGGNRRSTVDVGFSRSDSTIWNVGFNFRRLTSDKQVGNEVGTGDNHALSTAYNIYTRWRPSEKYQLLANISRIKHTVSETGGVRPLASGSIDDLFNQDSAFLWLNDAATQEIHINYHLYHQYKIGNGLQLYHAFDLTNQTVSFNYNLGSNESEFFDAFLINDAETSDETAFNSIMNEGGVKGSVGTLFYNFYVKARQYRYNPKYLAAQGYNTEIYLGSYLRYDYKNNQLKFEGEYLLAKDYKVKASFENQFIQASYQRVRRQPSRLSEEYFGNHYEWHNNFDPTNADEIRGMITWDRDTYFIRPYLSLTNVSKYIYFNQSKQPQQADGSVQMLTPGANLGITLFKNLHLEADWAYTAVTGDEDQLFRIPELFGNGKIYYANFLFKRALQAEIGLDLHYQSAYKANAYDPIIQQFYVQDTFTVPEYWTSDIFINFKVGRVRIFAKLVFANQALTSGGYFTSPYYIGQPSVFDWGINWQFFD